MLDCHGDLPDLCPFVNVIQLQLRGMQDHCWLAARPDRHPTHCGHCVRLRARRARWPVKGPGGLQLQRHPQLSAEHRWATPTTPTLYHGDSTSAEQLLLMFTVIFLNSHSPRTCREAGVWTLKRKAVRLHAGTFPPVWGLLNTEGMCVFAKKNIP